MKLNLLDTDSELNAVLFKGQSLSSSSILQSLEYNFGTSVKCSGGV
jgi:hypothetical protein